jgi:hypothetical protein
MAKAPTKAGSRRIIKFEQLHAEDQADIILEMLRLMFDGRHRSVDELASAQDKTPPELWRDVCAELGLECQPWDGYPAWVKRESFQNAPGANRELPDYLQTLLGKMRAWVGKDKQ